MYNNVFYENNIIMKDIYVIKNPEVFQGEDYLKFNNEYFEGWYFKNSAKDIGISFIPGININNNEKKAFIQVITKENSYYIDYDITEFKYCQKPFYIKIGNNIFSKEGIKIDIHEKKNNPKIYGELKYLNSKNIKTTTLNPNIMGPFSYIPFMECNHAILSMKNDIYGSINIGNNTLCLDKGIGYIEKDWGYSFPKKYIWCQANNFENKDVSFMISIANIPFKVFEFRGFISDLIIGKEEYRFATYNNAKIIKCSINENSLDINLKKKDYLLNIEASTSNGFKLSAPTKGTMSREITESILSNANILLKKKDKIIFKGTSENCGLEIVK